MKSKVPAALFKAARYPWKIQEELATCNTLLIKLLRSAQIWIKINILKRNVFPRI